MGIDYWLPEYTAVHTLFDAEVVVAVNDGGDKEYGGLVILQHRIDGHNFFTLYGHLTVASATQYNVGDQLKKGDKIGELGTYPENGNWAPHLHFQLMLSIMSYVKDFPGVAYHSQLGHLEKCMSQPKFSVQIPRVEGQDNQLIRHQ